MKPNPNGGPTAPNKNYDANIAHLEKTLQGYKDIEFAQDGKLLIRQSWAIAAWAVVMGLLALFVALYLHQAGIISFGRAPAETASRENADFRNLLTVLLPLFGAAIVFIVSAAGMKRLQAYDTEFARMREERRKDAADLREELRGDIKDEKELSKERFEQTKEEIRDTTQREVNDALKDGAKARTAELDGHFNTLQDKFTNIESKITDKFGVLVDFPTIKNMADDRPASAGVAHKTISILFHTGKINEAVAYTLAVLEKLKANNASGTPNDWFNISSVLGSFDQEKLGFEICLAAIEFYRGNDDGDYSPNIDLLAHGIQFAGKSAEYTQGLKWIEEAEGDTGKARWNWRMYIFVADFYAAIGQTDKLEEVEKAFRKALPDDQRSVTNTAVRLKQAGDNLAAYKLVSDWIEAYGKRNKRKPFAETAYYLLTDISVVTGRYEDALTFSALALGASVGDQPSVSISAIWFYRASAFDALFVAHLDSSPDRKDFDVEKAKILYFGAANGYHTAMKHPKNLVPTMNAQAKLRMHDLQALILEKGLEGDIPPMEPSAKQDQTGPLQDQIVQLQHKQNQMMQFIQALAQKMEGDPEQPPNSE